MSLLSHRRLGKSDLMVSPIGLGCWQFSKGHGITGSYWKNIPDEQISQIVQVSLQSGINWFDTAEAYGWGESERSLASALVRLGHNPDAMIIATKWWPLFRTARNLEFNIQHRCSALQVPRIDLYQVHWPFSLSSIDRQMRSMAKLADAGLLRYIGVSNFSAQAMRLAHQELQEHDLFLTSNQVEFNLINRKIEHNGLLDTAKELGISIIAYSPLGQGLLTGKFHESPKDLKQVGFMRRMNKAFNQRKLENTRSIIEVLKSLAQKYHVTPAQIALNWVVSVHAEHVVAIVGASTVEQARENARTMDFRLSQDDIELLKHVSDQYAAGEGW